MLPLPVPVGEGRGAGVFRTGVQFADTLLAPDRAGNYRPIGELSAAAQPPWRPALLSAPTGRGAPTRSSSGLKMPPLERRASDAQAAGRRPTRRSRALASQASLRFGRRSGKRAPDRRAVVSRVGSGHVGQVHPLVSRDHRLDEDRRRPRTIELVDDDVSQGDIQRQLLFLPLEPQVLGQVARPKRALIPTSRGRSPCSRRSPPGPELSAAGWRRKCGVP